MWLKASMLGLVIVGSLGTPWLVWLRAEAQWRQREQVAHQQAEQLATTLAENGRLSNLVMQAKSVPALSNGQERELLRLRSEVGRLRRTAREIERLRATHPGQLVDSNRPAECLGLDAPPEDQPILISWSKSQLASAGYADPTTALQTALWAMSSGNPEALAASVTPEAKTTLGRQDWTGHKSLPEELAERGQWIAEALGPINGFYVTGQHLNSPDQAILDVFFGGEGKTRQFQLKNVEGQWKVNAMGLGAGGNGELKATLWP